MPSPPLPTSASLAHSMANSSERYSEASSNLAAKCRWPRPAKWDGVAQRSSGYSYWCWDCGASIGQHCSRLDVMLKPYTYSEREVTPPEPPEAEYDAETGNCWGAETPCEIQYLPVCLWCEIDRLGDDNLLIASSVMGAIRELSVASRVFD